ncbi:MAG TPA: hypothetical protein ENN67_02725, partial [Firmicutes bacterium]|nr:hypothetical protein [Bacillota bacterium]
ATVAWLNGREYPMATLDRAWRILCHTSHHDAVTGSESDQVYIDLCALLREAHDISCRELMSALKFLSETDEVNDDKHHLYIKVFNSLTWSRDGVVRIDRESLPGDYRWAVHDKDGLESPVYDSGNGFEFIARDIPPLGFKELELIARETVNEKIDERDSNSIENEFFKITVNPDSGGSVSSIFDKKSGREYLRKGKNANVIAVYPEYPGMDMGPWRIQPTGDRFDTNGLHAQIERTISPGCQSIKSIVEFQGTVVERTVTLRKTEPFIDFTTSIIGFSGHDKMWRSEFGMDIDGTVPVAQTSGGVIGRGFGRVFSDFTKEEYFGDWAIDKWGGLECPLSFKVPYRNGDRFYPVTTGEIVIPDNPSSDLTSAIDRLVPMLALAGITTVVTKSSSRRAEAIDWSKDSSRPDFRIAFGDKNSNSLIRLLFDEYSPIEIGFDDCIWIDPANTRISGLDLPVVAMPQNPETLNALIDRWADAIATPPAILDGINSALFNKNKKSYGR